MDISYNYYKSIILLVFFTIFSSVVQAKTQKVLVLHSYHQGLEWTDSISSGIKSVLGARENNVEIYYDYLDTKRNAGDHYSSKLVELFRAKSHRIPFDLIITSDNDALEFVKNYGRELFPDTPVVFCGVNYFSDKLISGIRHVTGVVEKADVEATLELMLKVHPNKEKIMVILDQTSTGLALRKSVEEVEPFFDQRVELEYFTDFTWDSIRQKLSTLGREYLVYLLTINRDSKQEFMSYIDGIAIVNDSSAVPVYGSWDFYLGKGIVGGVITSGFEQGKQAALYALKILSGTPVNELPIIMSLPNKKVFDYKAMSKFGVDRSLISGDAIILNEPGNLWRKILLLPVWAFAVVGSVIILLISLLVFLKGKNNYIAEMNLALENKVIDRTEKLNNSNAKKRQLIVELEKTNKELEESNKKLNLMSIKDSVTDIYNRRYLSDKLTEEYSLAQEREGALSILMLDVDYFKVINDSFGHQYGDYVLRTISKTIQGLLRENDTLGRYGSEEFLIVLPETTHAEAFSIADQIRGTVEAIDWDRDNLTVTISGGIAEYQGQPEMFMLRQADLALYKAKSRGRNRII